MGGKIKSFVFRYGLPLLAFGLLVALPYLIKSLFGVSFDTSWLIIGLMIATAWFLGRGPGLMIAAAFELLLIYYSTAPYAGRAYFITFNRLALFVAIVLFASARRRAETELREQRELLQVTLASIGDAVIATDPQGRVNFINPTAAELTGWTAEEAAGRPFAEVFRIVSEATRAPVESPYDKILREKRIVGLANHTLLLSKDGRELPIEDSGAPIFAARGELVGTIIVFHDVSARRTAERERERLLASERQARAAAEEASRLKDEFLATVSHELRTPLSAILGWSSLLKKTPADEKTVRRAAEIIERNAKAQSEIIGDILDVSQIITGKMRVHPELTQVVPLVRQTIENMRPAAFAKSLTVTCEDEGGEALVIADPDRLRQIVWNLIANAVKFTPEGGRIRVAVRAAGDALELAVADDGIGIEPEALPLVFDRFRQLDSSTTRAKGGLGLGLAIVRHLVEMHGGAVEAASEGRGRGAAFTVRLPIAERGDKLSPASDGSTVKLDSYGKIVLAAPDLQGLRVLLVDDDADTLEILGLALDRFGAVVRTAESCAAALAAFDEWRPDVLISDIGMPHEDGYALIGRIRALPDERGGRVPAAALTAYVGDRDRRQVLSAGFQVHIAKPVDPVMLAAEVLKLAGRD